MIYHAKVIYMNIVAGERTYSIFMELDEGNSANKYLGTEQILCIYFANFGDIVRQKFIISKIKTVIARSISIFRESQIETNVQSS